jgi:alpha-D-ribose 1-methylphosphonate 5-triphosphate synthase subunit PhnG
MNRTVRCELLARLPDNELKRLAELATSDDLGEFSLVTPPTVGMVMARVIEGARGETFNVGEVLVTECLVALGEHEGWAMLMGSRPTGALAAATIDAASVAGTRHIDRIDAEIAQLNEQIDAAELAERKRLHATRVQFDTQ